MDETVGQNQILVVSGACDNITPAEVQRTHQLIDEADIVLLQLEVNMDAIEQVIDYAHAKGKQIVLNTAPRAQAAGIAAQKAGHRYPQRN